MKMNGLYATFVHIIGLTGPAEPPEDESDDTAFQTQRFEIRALSAPETFLLTLRCELRQQFTSQGQYQCNYHSKIHINE